MKKNMVLAGTLSLLITAGCSKRGAEPSRELETVTMTPPKITVTKKQRPKPKPLPGRCDRSDDCQPTFKCVLSRCRKAPCRVAIDKDADGHPDKHTVYTYDEKGLVLTKIVTGADGTVEDRVTYQYDDNGNGIGSQVFQHGKRVEKTETAYRDNGTVKSRVVKRRQKVTESTFDEQGNKISTTLDTNGDGNVDRQETFSYDAHGNLQSRTLKNAKNQKPINRRVFTYNENHRPTSEKLDLGDDGLFEETTLYEYDGHGNELVRQWTSVKPTPSQPDTWLRWEFKRNEFGLVDRWDVIGQSRKLKARTVYTYNPRGDVITKDTLIVKDGKPIDVGERMTYSYDASARLIAETKTQGAKGPAMVRITYDYTCWE